MVELHSFEVPILTSGEVVALAAITYRQLDSWQRIGLHHSARLAGGSGVPRGYSRDDLLFFAAQGVLARIGVGPRDAIRFRDLVIAAIASLRRAAPGQPPTPLRIEAGEMGEKPGLPGLTITLDLARLEAALEERLRTTEKRPPRTPLGAHGQARRPVKTRPPKEKTKLKLQGGKSTDFED